MKFTPSLFWSSRPNVVSGEISLDFSTSLEMTIGRESRWQLGIVRLDGILDSYIAEEMGDKFESLHDLEDTEITLDCTKLEYIASSGLRLFLLLLRNTKPNGCKIIIKGTSPEVMEIFKETGFDKCFQFV